MTVRVAALYDIHGNRPGLEAVLADVEAAAPDLVVSGSRRLFAGVAENVVVCGHTHHQFDREVLGKRLLNAGSVGMPYEDEAAAYRLLLGPGAELRRTDYDVAAATERLRAAGLPDVDELMLRESLLEPIGTAAVARLFEERATR